MIDRMREPYKTLIEKLVDVLKRRYGDRFISLIVYGSVARGGERKDSDVDLLLIIDSIPGTKLERQKDFIDVEKEIQVYLDELFDKGYLIDFSPIIKTPEEAKRISPLYLDMVDDAIITYDRDDFFKNILGIVRNRLKELKSKRVSMGRKWYWVLKPDYRFGDVIQIG